ncbi:ParB/RepB/Spo0J family partition protein [Bradyrhizobium sp. JYMT SZCCT0428]|uniref:ParB/RepB/Spo0J family partition protein n=1 Tax=Bradyrhizobium sp. JYMT SZCCT0428 TaxID=2807673 RepID=UPI001BA536DC|nr:ParB/RepB/Spo0J family partition protein [Bradyrhizobium sp. JYMT SZCCT0428]MBR1152974.1 ParB-like nuclease domain-containing protein [Bradyrhizobium sp. JYMT SZCCT0428]
MAKKIRPQRSRRPPRLRGSEIVQPGDTGHTLADIAALLAKTDASFEQPKGRCNLKRDSIFVAAKAFQWRLPNENEGARDDHIQTLANAIRDTGKPLDPILVFTVGDAFYVVDGHHRLAAYDTAQWRKMIPATVFEGTLEGASDAGRAGNIRDKLPMSRNDKREAAWTLGKRDPLPTREWISSETAVSPSSIDGMRKVLKALKAKGIEAATIDGMTYAQALGKMSTDDGGEPWEPETWMQKAADKIVKRIEAAGIGFLLRQDHEIAAIALERVNAALVHTLVAEWLWRPENQELADEFIADQRERKELEARRVPEEPQRF